MSVRPRINLYLVHQETGQRYAVGQEVIIGRSSGDIIFNDDIKMSSHHCRIFRTPQGLGLHDLGSSNGTYLDGIRLNPEKVYVFKPGSSLSVGYQYFKLEELNVTRPATRKRRPKQKPPPLKSFDWVSLFITVLIIGSILYLAHRYQNSISNYVRLPRLQLLSPLNLVEIEMKAAFTEYANLGRAHTSKKIGDKELAYGIRNNLVPRLTASYEKLGVLKPSSEFERRKIEVNRKLILALRDQVVAMAKYAETKNPNLAKEIERLSAVAAAANEEAQKLEESRSPARINY